MDLLEKNLAAFPYDMTYSSWKSLTNFLTEHETFQLMKSLYISSDQVDNLHLGQFDLRHSFPENADTTLITKYSIDKSYLLDWVISQSSEDRILAEFQFCFVLFSLLQKFEGFEAWKQWLLLCLNCDEAIVNRYGFFETFISCLRFQIQECPLDFFHEFFDNQTFLPSLFRVNVYSRGYILL